MKTLLILLVSLYSVCAFSDPGDGVIFDEHGLTIKIGQAPVVDRNRWNSSEGIYTLINGPADFYVKVIKNPEGKVVAVRKEGGGMGDFRTNGIYSAANVLVTTKFCEQLDESATRKNFNEAMKCQDSLIDFFKNYEAQATEEVLKKFQDIAKIDGMPGVKNIKMLEITLKEQVARTKMSFVATVGYLTQKCNDLKRYSTEEVASTPAAIKGPVATTPK